MKVLFAIDLLDGKCVRLKKGDFKEIKVYSENPISVVDEMVSVGAKDFHIIDLNGAREGKPFHLQIVKEIRKRTTGYVQVGGGIRTKEVVKLYKELGIDGIIVGTRAYIDPGFLPSLREYDGVILSVDIKNGKPMIMGWEKEAKISISEILKLAEECSVFALLITAIERDGTLSGPDLEVLKMVRSSTEIPIIASGGIRGVEDLESLKKIGVYGAIVGKAIYEKTIKIDDILRFSKG